MAHEPSAEKFTLVHGLGPNGYPHAWIETGDGRVYDPVADTYTAIEDYAGVAQCRYTRREMLQACSDHTWGPWPAARYNSRYKARGRPRLLTFHAGAEAKGKMTLRGYTPTHPDQHSF
jgi:hypothetical protein